MGAGAPAARPPGGIWQSVARHVAAYDLRSDGSLVYTNGYNVVSWREGTAHTLARLELVETVVTG